MDLRQLKLRSLGKINHGIQAKTPLATIDSGRRRLTHQAPRSSPGSPTIEFLRSVT